MTPFLELCARSVVAGDADRAEELARAAGLGDRSPLEVVEGGFAAGIREVGRLWEAGEVFLPELVLSARAMKRAMAVLAPALAGAGAEGTTKGRVVLGTIEGDIHDIGKTLVGAMLAAHGFTVTDLGADVPPARFAEAAAETGAVLVGVSSLLTTTMAGQRRVVEELDARGLRDAVRVIVGGAPVTAAFAAEIGADGTAGDAVAAVALAERLVS